MKIKNNQWQLTTELQGFCFDFEGIEFSIDNVRERILHIDKTIIDSGAKNKLFNIFPINFFEQERKDKSIGEYYFDERMKLFWNNKREGLGKYAIAQFYYAQKFSNQVSGYPNTYFYQFSENDKSKVIFKSYPKYFGTLILDTISFDCKDIVAFKEKKDCKYDFSIVSNSNIWYEKILDRNFNEVGNSILAYQNTPRFNSFFRALKAVCVEYGGTVNIDTTETINHKYLTEDGILLGGKIIYQEDIENGLIKIPNT